MRLQDLDEWQGLTRQMIVSHLNRVGWCSLIGNENMYLLKPAYVQLEVFGDFAGTIGRLAEIEGRTPQALLRIINPRMRSGLPSIADMAAHGEHGDWISSKMSLHCVRFCWTVNDFIQMIDGCDVFSTKRPEEARIMADCSYWPCDAAGNKVRWPEVATAVKP